MSTTIQSLLDFVTIPGKQPSADLAAAEAEIGRQRLRVVSIKLSSWLKLQKRLAKPKPLQLESGKPWCVDLQRLLESQPDLKSVIAFREGTLVLSPDLPGEERERLLALVDARSRPELMR